jgi:nucleoside-diphosphate-sugar epimerase
MADPAPEDAMTSPGRRCVVTGAAGFIGSHLVDRLLADGHEVLGVDCFTDYYPRDEKERNLDLARSSAGFRLVEADLRTAPLEPLLEGADTVFHLAAMGGLLRSWTWFDEYMTCNVQATQRLLEAARAVGLPHLVHASTSSVYGRDSSGDEDRPKCPDSPYGVTKLAAENLVFAYSRNFSLPVTVLRYFSIYGPRQRPDMGYRIFIDALLEDDTIRIHGDGRQSRGNTYVDDCVEATVAAMRHGPAGTALNIGGGQNVTAIEVVRLLEEIVGRPARLEFVPPRPGEQARALADVSRAKTVLGWSPVTPVEEGLRRQVAWQRAVGAAGAAA